MERVAPIFENFQSFLQILRAIKMQEQFFFYYRLKKNKFNILRLYYVSISFVSNYSCISAYIYIYMYISWSIYVFRLKQVEENIK